MSPRIADGSVQVPNVEQLWTRKTCVFPLLRAKGFSFRPPFPRGDVCITSERFAGEDPVPGSLARTCPRSFGFVRQFLRRRCSSGLLASSSAHFAQDDTESHSLIVQSSPLGKGGRCSDPDSVPPFPWERG